MIPKVRSLLIILVLIGLCEQSAPILIVGREPALRQTIGGCLRARAVQMRDKRHWGEAAKRTGIGPFQGGVDWHPVRDALEAVDVGHRWCAPTMDFGRRAWQGLGAAVMKRVPPKARGNRGTVGTVEAEGVDRFSDGELDVRAADRASHPWEGGVEWVDERARKLAHAAGVKGR